MSHLPLPVREEAARALYKAGPKWGRQPFEALPVDIRRALLDEADATVEAADRARAS
jgi:hypothetical protein